LRRVSLLAFKSRRSLRFNRSTKAWKNIFNAYQSPLWFSWRGTKKLPENVYLAYDNLEITL
jgi:hypothetical protein